MMNLHDQSSSYSPPPSGTSAISTLSIRTSSESTGLDSLMPTPLPSPSASAFLRTAATLEGLAKQLGNLKDEDETEGESRCCCGAVSGCSTWRDRERIEDKLKLSGEIGDALLQRYEALERKHARAVEQFEKQLEAKRNALAESLRRVNNLEKANSTHMAHFTEITKKNEALEKRYTQALHTQTLTQQSLTHVRSELTALRSRSQRHGSRVSEMEAEERFMESEERYEELRDQYEIESRSAKDETRRRKRAEARVEELQAQLETRNKEVEEVREARAKDAQELLANAKERLTILHSELSETFRAESPADAPEYQKTLEDLVASNALLKHDASELALLLNDAREEIKTLREEAEGFKSNREDRRLASELQRHSRTESTPNVVNPSDRSWARMSVHLPATSRMSWEHQRKTSLAPSFTSTSTGYEPMSPGLGMGPVGEYGAVVEATLSPTADGRESPRPVFRTSPSGGIGYVLNGVPKSKVVLPKPPARRAHSDRPRPVRTYSPNSEAIAEWTAGTAPEEPVSPNGSEYFRSEVNRKRRSILLSRVSTREEGELSPIASNTLVEQSIGDVSPMSDGATSPHEKRVHRRTLLLLTKSVGTQTDAVDDVSTVTSPKPVDSETSSLHGGGVMTALVEHLGKLLVKLKGADVPNLNRRLKKHNLPGDVAHLSRTTLRTLHQDVAELRSAFKGVLDIPIINRREFVLLLKLLKDVFGELIDLQAIVNDVTIDPSLAKKLQRDAYREEDDKAKGGLGWIAAPITKFFVTPAQEEVPPKERRDKERLQAGTIKAPKLQASTSATTTHVSVEFGGAGIVRRATPAGAPQPEAPEQSGESLVPPRPAATLRPSKSRANRNELLGIFAGASTRPISPTNWVVVPTPSPIPPRQLRAASSQYFGDKTIRANDSASRKRLSAAVDAVIDRTADQIDETDPATAGDYEPPLLERTLRPRGLSDSSIRSTFIAHETETYGSSVVPRGYLGTFASRFYPFKASTTEPVTQPQPQPEPETAPEPIPVPVTTVQAPTPSKPIATTRATMSSAGTSPMSTSATMGQSQGLLGMLASSITAAADVEDDEADGDGELRGGKLRRGMGRTTSQKGVWR